LRNHFNAYVKATRTGWVPATEGKGDADFARMFPTETQPRHALGSLVMLHYGCFLQWRKTRLGHAHELPGLKQNTNKTAAQDIEDIRGADEELRKEVAFLESQEADKYAQVDDPMMDAIRTRSGPVLQALAGLAGPFSLPAAIGGAVASDKIGKALVGTMQDKQRQWEGTLREQWLGEPILKNTESRTAVARLFEDYIHDSRAWFKALFLHDDSDSTKARLLKAVVGSDGYEMASDDEEWFTLGGREREKATQRRALNERMADQQKRGDLAGADNTRKALADLEANGPLMRGGREPYRMYGYLRFRKLYQNGVIDAAAHDRKQATIEQDEQARRKADLMEKEKARHKEERKKILSEQLRVMQEGRLKGAQLDEYLNGTEFQLDSEDRLHEENKKIIERGA
jgi:hypothetical protein